jgi:hypothetical protein
MADGVCFLANDAVYDLAVAFLSSLRAVNGVIPLCLIPFDDKIVRLRRAAPRFGFDIFEDDVLLRSCDRLSAQFHGSVFGHYRKLAAWDGPFDRFIYIDVDTIVQADLTIAFEFLSQFGYVAGHSRMAITRKWVWKDSIYLASYLTPSQINYAANTGFICSKRGLLGVEEAQRRVSRALPLRPHMELRSFEQPFLNYLIVTSGQPYSSLSEIAASDKSADLPVEVWAGQPGGTVEGAFIRFPNRRRVLFVHWAGHWSEKPARETASDDPTDPTEMPYGSLWRYYRNLAEDLEQV